VPQGRRTKQIAPDVAAYVAGLIDGEGTVTLTRLHANENLRVVVSIANTELQLLRFVIDTSPSILQAATSGIAARAI